MLIDIMGYDAYGVYFVVSLWVFRLESRVHEFASAKVDCPWLRISSLPSFLPSQLMLSTLFIPHATYPEPCILCNNCLDFLAQRSHFFRPSSKTVEPQKF